jgi:hypothetical protein
MLLGTYLESYKGQFRKAEVVHEQIIKSLDSIMIKMKQTWVIKARGREAVRNVSASLSKIL